MANDFKSTYEEIIRNLYAQSVVQGTRSDIRNYLISPNGTFLGKLTNNVYDANSIFNEYGQYGSEYSALSIFNEYGQYGGEYSALSPFNEYANTPPKIFLDNKLVGYLTKNQFLPNPHEPNAFLKSIRESQEYNY